MKSVITLTWSKLMAAMILIVGFVSFIMLLKAEETNLASGILTTCITISAGLLGWRQLTTAAKVLAPTLKKDVVDDDRFPKESSDVPAPDSGK